MHAQVSMLSAIPRTPLYQRLAAEGRIDAEHRRRFGTNVIPRNMSRQALRDGYVDLLRALTPAPPALGALPPSARGCCPTASGK